MNSCLYEGWVLHRRTKPVRHEFRYRIFEAYLDLDELDGVFRGRWLWSASRPSLAWFRRGDYLGDPNVPLDQAVRDLVEARIGRRPQGPIRLLTHLRYFGYAMNPVSFYYCFDNEGERVETTVAEVNNTPWRERYCFVLPSPEISAPVESQSFDISKDFHVSPFMPMNQTYRWQFSRPGERLAVTMESFEGGEKLFDAKLSLVRRPIDSLRLAYVLIAYPFMTTQVILAIYWQALRLWVKGVSFYPHPRQRRATGAENL